MKKYSVFLFITSLVFSACTQRSANTELASEPSLTSPSYSNMSMSSNSSMTSMELKKDDGFDQTGGERYAEIDENPFLETTHA
ncbi:MAG: hypothetical protein H0T08_06580, partial [Acidobacteria bacterium]|nr:hypothetical protein [Acidobacteriota bacterium]